MKCSKCGNQIFIITTIEKNQALYFARMDDDGSLEVIEECGNSYCLDTEYPNAAECSKCGKIIAIPDKLSDEEQNAIRQRVVAHVEGVKLCIPSSSRIEQDEDGYWVDVRVWIRKEKP